MEVTPSEIRALVERPLGDAPVTSVYLNTDGSRYPRPEDYEARLEGLLRDVRHGAEKWGEEGRQAVEADIDRIRRWVRDEFERGDVRGLGLFSSAGDLFETVEVAKPVRNVARVSDRPYVVPLEALLGRHHHIGLVIVERDKARIFRYQLGRVWEYQGLATDVHRHHKQGGWSAQRYQRNIEHTALHHKKDTDEVLRKLHEEHPLHALVIAGPHAEAMELSRNLHPYLREVLHEEPITMPLEVDASDLMERFTAVEQELVSARRRQLLDRLAAAQGQAEKAARGIRHVLEAMNARRVEVLFVVEGAGEPGYRSANNALALTREGAAAYGEPVTPVDDVIDELIEEAVRSGAQIEFFRDETRLDGHPVAALLRF